MPYRTILVGTDGSAFAQAAERAAITLAQATGAKVVAVTTEGGDRATAALERAAAQASDRGVEDFEAVAVPGGDPVATIVEQADLRGADLVVLGSRGLTAGMGVVGGVASGVANRGPCDLLLVGDREPGPDGPHDYSRIVIATDGSATADRAAARGYALAERFGSQMTLVFVGHPKTGEMVLQDTVATLGERFEPELRIVQGEPAEEITRAAADAAAGLLVVGNKGLTGMRGKLMGSVPKGVVADAPCDVLIVRTVTQGLGEIKKGEGGLVEAAGEKIAVYKDEKGNVTALSSKCTHMGCTVGWNSADKTWDCPCHGSRFAPDGAVVHGPAKKPLGKSSI